ncbi:MAG: hypothetical protein ACP5E4_02725 [Candidatus Aenigmatarchaeota archaeon]
MDAEEFEKLKERVKLNFFQIEKSLAEFDTRLDHLEKIERKAESVLMKLDKKAFPKSRGGKEENLLEATKVPGQNISLMAYLDILTRNVDKALVKTEQLNEMFSEAGRGKGGGRSPETEAELKELKKSLEGISKEFGELKGGAKLPRDELKKAVSLELKPLDEIEKRLNGLEDRVASLKTPLPRAEVKAPAEIPKAEIKRIVDEEIVPLKEALGEALIRVSSIETAVSEGAAKTGKGVETRLKNAETALGRLFEHQDKSSLDAKRSEQEIRKFVQERLRPVEDIRNQISELDEKLADAKALLETWQDLKKEVDMDKKLYEEIKSAALEAVERLRAMEEEFDSSVGELGTLKKEINVLRKDGESLLGELKKELLLMEENEDKLKDSMAAFSRNLKSEVRAEISRQDEKNDVAATALKNEVQLGLARIEGEALAMTNKTGAKLIKQVGDFADRLEENTNSVLAKQTKRIKSIGKQFRAIEEDFGRLKTEVVEKTIDDEMNKLLIILSEKMKVLATMKEFDLFRDEIRHKVDEIRSPEMRPLESRIYCLEEDISELKRLLRGISQRLPVVVE